MLAVKHVAVVVVVVELIQVVVEFIQTLLTQAVKYNGHKTVVHCWFMAK